MAAIFGGWFLLFPVPFARSCKGLINQSLLHFLLFCLSVLLIPPLWVCAHFFFFFFIFKKKKKTNIKGRAARGSVTWEITRHLNMNWTSCEFKSWGGWHVLSRAAFLKSRVWWLETKKKKGTVVLWQRKIIFFGGCFFAHAVVVVPIRTGRMRNAQGCWGLESWDSKAQIRKTKFF